MLGVVKRREGLWMGCKRSVECTVCWVIGGYRLEDKRKGPRVKGGMLGRERVWGVCGEGGV